MDNNLKEQMTPLSAEDTTISIDPTHTNGSLRWPCGWKAILIPIIALCIVVIVVPPVVVTLNKTSNGITRTGALQEQAENDSFFITQNSFQSNEGNKITNNTSNGCILHTPKELLRKLTEDPFGDECEYGSSYVNDTCENPIHDECKECQGKKLPSVCFCDKKIHCSMSNDWQRPRDVQGKESCDDCLGHFHLSKYKTNGNCTCDNKDLTCECNEGFGQFMCSSVLKRICQLHEKKSSLPLCFQTNDASCLHFLNKKKYICNVFKESNRQQRQSLPYCTENTTNIP